MPRIFMSGSQSLTNTHPRRHGVAGILHLLEMHSSPALQKENEVPKMNEKETVCEYYHPSCASGCSKVQCRARFPEKAPILMESQKAICKSDEHLECLIRLDGLEYHAKRVREKRGCPFLTNSQCGHPNDWRCDGWVPPFKIDGANLELLQACFGNEFPECPNYQVGVKFRVEANRISKQRKEEAKNKPV